MILIEQETNKNCKIDRYNREKGQAERRAKNCKIDRYNREKVRLKISHAWWWGGKSGLGGVELALDNHKINSALCLSLSES